MDIGADSLGLRAETSHVNLPEETHLTLIKTKSLSSAEKAKSTEKGTPDISSFSEMTPAERVRAKLKVMLDKATASAVLCIQLSSLKKMWCQPRHLQRPRYETLTVMLSLLNHLSLPAEKRKEQQVQSQSANHLITSFPRRSKEKVEDEYAHRWWNYWRILILEELINPMEQNVPAENAQPIAATTSVLETLRKREKEMVGETSEVEARSKHQQTETDFHPSCFKVGWRRFRAQKHDLEQPLHIKLLNLIYPVVFLVILLARSILALCMIWIPFTCSANVVRIFESQLLNDNISIESISEENSSAVHSFLYSNNNLGAVAVTGGLLNIIQWFAVTAFPVIQAARLTRHCSKLRHLGLEIAARPYIYSDATQESLDGFLLFTSSTHYAVGWRQFHSTKHDLEQPRYIKFLNIIYPITFFLLLLGTDITQQLTCFKRADVIATTDIISCDRKIITGTLVRDTLKLVIYVWGMYLFRYLEPEYLSKLIETVRRLISIIPLDITGIVTKAYYHIKLIIFFIKSIYHKCLKQGQTSDGTTKDVYRLFEFLKVLNGQLASMHGSMVSAILEKNISNEQMRTLGFFVAAFNIIQWTIIALTPIIQAARLTVACRELKYLGLLVSSRPYTYTESKQDTLDSFLLYTSSTNFTARLLGFSVYPKYIFVGLFAVLIFASVHTFQFRGYEQIGIMVERPCVVMVERPCGVDGGEAMWGDDGEAVWGDGGEAMWGDGGEACGVMVERPCGVMVERPCGVMVERPCLAGNLNATTLALESCKKNSSQSLPRPPQNNWLASVSCSSYDLERPFYIQVLNAVYPVVFFIFLLGTGVTQKLTCFGRLGVSQEINIVECDDKDNCYGNAASTTLLFLNYRVILALGFGWIVFSFCVSVIRIYSLQFATVHTTTIHIPQSRPSPSITDRVVTKAHTLQGAVKDIYHTSEFLHVLNRQVATIVTLCLFIFVRGLYAATASFVRSLRDDSVENLTHDSSCHIQCAPVVKHHSGSCATAKSDPEPIVTKRATGGGTEIGWRRLFSGSHDLEVSKLAKFVNCLYPALFFVILLYTSVAQLLTCFFRTDVWCWCGAGVVQVWCWCTRVVLVWGWNGAGVVLVWCWYGAGMVLEWCRYGAGVVLEWCWCGAGMVLEWCWNGAGVVQVWCWSGAGVVLVWCRYGAGVVLEWCWYGVGMVLEWCWSGIGVVRYGAGVVLEWCWYGAGCQQHNTTLTCSDKLVTLVFLLNGVLLTVYLIMRMFSLNLLGDIVIYWLSTDYQIVYPLFTSVPDGTDLTYDVRRYILVISALFGFVFFDLLYISVVIYYISQAQLIIYLLRSIKDKVRNKVTSLGEAVKLNMNLLEVMGKSDLAYAVGSFNIIQWSVITVGPIFQAARLTRECRQLKRLGLEIAARPYTYSDTPQKTLDSFLLYTNTTNYSGDMGKKKVHICGECKKARKPAIFAARLGHTDCLSAAYNELHVLNERDEYGATPIHYAARSGKLECLMWLVTKSGISPNAVSENGGNGPPTMQQLLGASNAFSTC
eukprot:Em0343g2a